MNPGAAAGPRPSPIGGGSGAPRRTAPCAGVPSSCVVSFEGWLHRSHPDISPDGWFGCGLRGSVWISIT